MFVTSSGKWTVNEAEGKFDNYGVYDQLSDQWKPGDEWRIFLYGARAESQRKTKVDVEMMVEVLLLLSFVRSFRLPQPTHPDYVRLLSRAGRRWYAQYLPASIQPQLTVEWFPEE